MQNILNFEYEIIKSRRKSIGIIISPDCKVKIRVPMRAKQSVIDDVIRKKTSWIEKKIAFLSPFLEKKLENKISFLGKDYELIFKDENAKKSVSLEDKKIIITGKNPKTQFQKWLFLKASELFLEHLDKCFLEFSKRFSYKKPILRIRKMKSRWGSLSNAGIMTLNLNLISASLDCIDYVIMHELCHLRHQNHGKNFHKLEESFSPNAKELNLKLKSFGIWLKLEN